MLAVADCEETPAGGFDQADCGDGDEGMAFILGDSISGCWSFPEASRLPPVVSPGKGPKAQALFAGAALGAQALFAGAGPKPHGVLLTEVL